MFFYAVCVVCKHSREIIVDVEHGCFHSSVQLFCGHGLGLITFWDSGIMYMRTVILKMDSL